MEYRYELAHKAAHEVGEARLAAYHFWAATVGPGGRRRVPPRVLRTPPPRDAAALRGLRVDRKRNHYRATRRLVVRLPLPHP